MISPSATDLQKRKLKIKGIEFIELEKIDDPSANIENENGHEKKLNPEPSINGININKSSENSLKTTLKADRFQTKTIEKLITSRPYKDFNDLVSKTGFGSSIQKKLRDKIDRGEIYLD